jgi:hypothetical protein
MARGDIVTVRDGGRWRNHVEGQGLLDGAYENRLDAALIGRELARERRVAHSVDDANAERAREYAAESVDAV